jgi:transposase-like protein
VAERLGGVRALLAYNAAIRQVIYSTNAIESLHARSRRSVRARGGSFPFRRRLPTPVRRRPAAAATAYAAGTGTAGQAAPLLPTGRVVVPPSAPRGTPQ